MSLQIPLVGRESVAVSTEPIISYAQNHEDIVLARVFRPWERKGFWVDIGAGDPIEDSVTALFSSYGWRGLNVEPMSLEYERLVKERPADINLQVAVSNHEGTATLYCGPPENRGMSTMDETRGETYLRDGFTKIEVPLTTMALLSKKYLTQPVDFLKIDVEGLERSVLEGMDWTTLRPTVIVMEATLPGTRTPSHGEWEDLLVANGYESVLFDGLNRYYIRRDDTNSAALREALNAPANVFDNFVTYSLAKLREDLEQALAHKQIEVDEALQQLYEIRGRWEYKIATRLGRVARAVPGLVQLRQRWSKHARRINAEPDSGKSR